MDDSSPPCQPGELVHRSRQLADKFDARGFELTTAALAKRKSESDAFFAAELARRETLKECWECNGPTDEVGSRCQECLDKDLWKVEQRQNGSADRSDENPLYTESRRRAETINGEAGNICWNPTSRREMDSVVIRETLIEGTGPGSSRPRSRQPVYPVAQIPVIPDPEDPDSEEPGWGSRSRRALDYVVPQPVFPEQGIPETGLPGRQWTDALAREAILKADLPECELGCDRVLQQVTEAEWERRQGLLNYDMGTSPYRTVSEKVLATSGEKEALGEIHRIEFSKKHRDQILDYLCPADLDSKCPPLWYERKAVDRDLLSMSEEDRFEAIMELIKHAK